MTWPPLRMLLVMASTADAQVRQIPLEASHQLNRPKLEKTIALERILESLLGRFGELDMPPQSSRFGVRYQLVELAVVFISGVGVVELRLAGRERRDFPHQLDPKDACSNVELLDGNIGGDREPKRAVERKKRLHVRIVANARPFGLDVWAGKLSKPCIERGAVDGAVEELEHLPGLAQQDGDRAFGQGGPLDSLCLQAIRVGAVPHHLSELGGKKPAVWSRECGRGEHDRSDFENQQ